MGVLYDRKLVTNRVRSLLPGVLLDMTFCYSRTGNDAVDMTQRIKIVHIFNITASRMSDEGGDETCDQTGHNSGQVSYSVN